MNDNTLSNTDSLNDIVKDGRQQLARGRNDFLLFNSQTVSPGTNLSSLDALKRDYLAYADVLDKALTLTEQGKLDDILRLRIQDYQVSMQDSYNCWRVTYEDVSRRGISENQKTFTEMLWTMGTVILLVIIIILLSWVGLRRMLIAPLKDNMQHLSTISQGDLTHSVRVEGNNEMAKLAESILHMQQSLIRTVSDVRLGSDSIYTGAGR
ncbi:HAMP domain-containing protein [Escherichia coli]|nr:HAMP domain-containing protein [Escherichia coli]